MIDTNYWPYYYNYISLHYWINYLNIPFNILNDSEYTCTTIFIIQVNG